jgi:hypothetical protein
MRGCASENHRQQRNGGFLKKLGFCFFREKRRGGSASYLDNMIHYMFLLNMFSK